MTQQEILESNKLIAEFLGSKFINDAPEDYPNGYYYQPKGVEYDCPTGESDEWCFNSSWDWLMPVVEKIEKIENNYHGRFGVHIISNACTIQATNFRPDKKIPYPPHYFSDHIGNNKIESVWLAVVEFIKWYNNQNKKS